MHIVSTRRGEKGRGDETQGFSFECFHLTTVLHTTGRDVTCVRAPSIGRAG